MNTRRHVVLVLCWLTIFANALMLQAAITVANRALMLVRDAHQFVFGAYLWLVFSAYLWIVALLSLHCAWILRTRTSKVMCSDGSTVPSSNVNCRRIICANLLTLPVAVVGAACSPELLGFVELAGIVALLSLCCGFISRTGIGWVLPVDGTKDLPCSIRRNVRTGQ